MDLGQRLKNLRKENNLSQQELGDKLGVKYSAVSKWERNENTPPLKIVYKLTKLYDITYDEIMEDIVFD